MEDLKKEVCQLIRDTRKANGLTQKEVSEKIGISEPSYNRYENGTANLSIDTIQKVGIALGVKFKLIIS